MQQQLRAEISVISASREELSAQLEKLREEQRHKDEKMITEADVVARHRTELAQITASRDDLQRQLTQSRSDSLKAQQQSQKQLEDLRTAHAAALELQNNEVCRLIRGKEKLT